MDDQRKSRKSRENSETWQLLTGAANKAMAEAGFVTKRLPGRGRSNIHEATKNGNDQRISVRTTRGRKFAFNPLEGGSKWKTLDDVDLVIVAAFDKRTNPEQVNVYKFDAEDVRAHFTDAYKARKAKKLSVTDNCGMWVSLYTEKGESARNVGSGLGDKYPPIATYPIDELRSGNNEASRGNQVRDTGRQREFSTIAEVVDWARSRISKLAGVDSSAVSLDLKIEYQ